MDSCKQWQRSRKCLRKQKAFKRSNAVKMGLIWLIKTPGTIRFTTRWKVMLERIHKQSEEGKSPGVPTAHEGEHRRKCVWLRTKKWRGNVKILFKMITGSGHRITWTGRLRWPVHITVTGRSVRSLVWSGFCDPLYTVSCSVRRSKLQDVIWWFVVSKRCYIIISPIINRYVTTRILMYVPCRTTRYGLNGLGIESWWRQDFPQPSRQSLLHNG